MLAGNLVILCILECVENLMDFLDYPSLAILLLMVGFVLIIAEIFLPSGGLILVMCLIAFIASFWSAYKAWYGVSSLAFGLYLAALVFLIPTVVIGTFNIFPKTPMGKRLIGAPTTEEVTPYAEEQAHLQSLIGHIGKTITPLIPGGMVSVEGERLHAFSEGVLIDPGVDVEILDVRGTRVLVREAVEVPKPQPPPTEPAETPSPSDVFLTESEAETDNERPLDFDVPQS
jgi:membrane-bound ClpP family serine protease